MHWARKGLEPIYQYALVMVLVVVIDRCPQKVEGAASLQHEYNSSRLHDIISQNMVFLIFGICIDVNLSVYSVFNLFP